MNIGQRVISNVDANHSISPSLLEDQLTVEC